MLGCFPVKGVSLRIYVALQCSSVCALFTQVSHIAVNDGIGVAVFLGSFLIGTGADAQQMPAVTKQTIVCPVCCGTAHSDHGNVVNQEHNHSKDGQTQPPVGNHPVNLIGGGHAALVFLLVAVLDDVGNVHIPLIGNHALCVIVHFLFRCGNILFDMLYITLGNGQCLQNLFVTLKDLDGVPALLFLRDIMQHRFFNMRNGMLHTAAELVLGDHGSTLLCYLDGSLSRFLDAGTLQCGDLHYLAAQLLGKLLCIDLIPVLPDNVHHIDGCHHRDTQLYQLGGQIQVPLQVGAVDDVQNRIRPLLDQIIPGYHFLQGVGGQGVNTRQVCDGHIAVTLQLTLLLFNRYAGPVTHKLVGSGQRIKQGGFACVRISRKRYFDSHISNPFFLFQLAFTN